MNIRFSKFVGFSAGAVSLLLFAACASNAAPGFTNGPQADTSIVQAIDSPTPPLNVIETITESADGVDSEPGVELDSPVAGDLASAEAARAEALGLVPAQLTRVVDGDTIDVELNGVTERVRLIGIDTPERGAAGFAEATAFTGDALDAVGGRVYLAADGADRDRFDRLRRNVWLGVPADLESQRSELLLNQMLLDSGHAVVWGTGPASDDAAPGPAAPGPTTSPEPDETEIPARFRNCAQVWEVLGRPIREGERGFHSGLDRDGDGVGCESRPRN